MAMRVGLREVINNLPELMVVSAVTCAKDLAAEVLDVLVMVSPAAVSTLENAQAVLYLTDDSGDIQDLLNLDFSAWGALPVNASEE